MFHFTPTSCSWLNAVETVFSRLTRRQLERGVFQSIVDLQAAITDPDARLFRKGRGKEAKLCHMGHLLMENRHGLIVDALLTPATGTAERAAAETMMGRQAGRHRATLGAERPTMWPSSWPTCAPSTSPPTSPRTPHAAQRSTAGRSVIPATP